MFGTTYSYQPLALLFVYNLDFLNVDTKEYILGYFFLVILPFLIPGLGIVVSRHANIASNIILETSYKWSRSIEFSHMIIFICTIVIVSQRWQMRPGRRGAGKLRKGLEEPKLHSYVLDGISNSQVSRKKILAHLTHFSWRIDARTNRIYYFAVMNRVFCYGGPKVYLTTFSFVAYSPMVRYQKFCKSAFG